MNIQSVRFAQKQPCLLPEPDIFGECVNFFEKFVHISPSNRIAELTAGGKEKADGSQSFRTKHRNFQEKKRFFPVDVNRKEYIPYAACE